MSSTIINEDFKNTKTERALYAAMFSLLKSLSFKRITIKGICEKALISRATFYAHFVDKYDLLKHWMTELWPKDFIRNDTYEEIERVINSHIYENMLVLKNLVCDADNETLDILFDFILTTIDLNVDKNSSEDIYPKNVVLSNFYVGGIMSYLLWQIKNKFPPDIPPMNKYLYKMIHDFQDWQAI